MVLRSFAGMTPDIHETAYVDEAAVVIGNVVIEEDASVWPNATLRGDEQGSIRVGEGTSVQDNSVFHEGTDVGSYVTVGHSAVVHGCVVHDDCLIGMGSVILTGADVGERSVVAAGAVVREGQEIPPDTLAAGVPAEPVRDLSDRRQPDDSERQSHYVKLARLHAETSEPLERSDLE